MNKRLILLLSTIYTVAALLLDARYAHAQDVPQGMNYQAVARDTLGMPLANRTLSIRLSLLRGSSTGSPVYVEMHQATTDDLGLFNVVIGGGKAASGSFPAINWGLRDYWLKVEIDIHGGSSYTDLGSQQLLSVPYALFARRSLYSDTATVALRALTGGGGGSDTLAWDRHGNTGTDPSTDYLGTGDSADLVLRTNGTERFRITADGKFRIEDMAGGGGRVVVTDAVSGGSLGSRLLSDLIDNAFIRSLGDAMPGDSSFVHELSQELNRMIARDPVFITELTSDSLFISRIKLARDTVFARDSVLLTRLTSDSVLINHLTRRIDTLFLRDSISLGSFIAKVESALTRDSLLIRSIAADTLTTAKLRAYADSLYWGLGGNSGTSPARSFLGTADASPLAFRTGNVERLRITAGDGNVGIGTSTPGAKLHVAGNIRLDSLAGTGSRLLLADPAGMIHADASAGSFLLRQLDTLFLKDSAFVAGLSSSAPISSRIRSVVDSSAWSLTGSIGTSPSTNFLGTRDNVGLAFRTNNIERLRIDAAGNMGIGTTAPGEKLELRDGNLLLANSNNVAAEIHLQEPSGSGTNYLALRARPLSANLVFEFPDQQGAPNTILSNDGSGHLSWADPTVLIGNSIWSVNGNAGLANTLFGTLDDAPIRFITGLGGPNERLRIDANGFVGINTTTPSTFLHVVNDRTTDELPAIYGVASRSTANQAIGVWGDADSSASGNTGTIGVLATGNGRTVAAETNVALQVNDGAITVGRTSEASPGYSVVENATSGVTYSAEGPSGVIEVNNLGGLLGTLGIGQSVILNHVTVKNRYVTPNSIVLVQVIDASGTNLGSLLNLTFSTLVDDRASGSFKLSVSAHLVGLLPLTLGGTDGIRIGYMVINPSK